MNKNLLFIKIISKKQKFKLSLLVFLMIIASIIDMVSLGSLAAYISLLVDKSSLEGFINRFGFENFISFVSNENLIINISILIVFIFLIKNLFLFYVNYYEIRILRDLRVEKTQELFEKYISFEYKEFISNNFSYYQRIILSEVNFIISSIQQLLNFIKESMIIFGVLIIFSLINLELTAYVFCFFIIISACYYFIFKKKLKSFGKIAQGHRLKKLRILNELGFFFKDIKIYNLKKIFSSFFLKEVYEDEKYRSYGDIINKSPRLIFEIICVSLIVFSLIFFEINNYEKNNYLPILSFFGIGLVRILPSFNIITQVLSKMKINQASNSLVFNELKNDIILVNQKDPMKAIYEKKLEFKNVSFSYKGAKILENFSCEFKKNTITGIFGESGTGKTTILNLLSGLLKPTSGQIFSDNIDISNFGIYWNRMISYMGQDTFILNETLKKNITLNFDKNISDDNQLLRETVLNLKLVNKDNIDDDLNKIFENSESLSGGEKQRVGIARSIYKDTSILLLDEPTNNLDSINEEIIFNKILSLKEKKTIVIVTHNLNFKKICDNIIEKF